MNRVECNGYLFTKDEKTGYFLSTKEIDGTRKRFHRYIWEINNGPIPDGLAIHHKDHNKDNNHISNLELVSSSKHAKHHNKITEDNYEEKKARFIKHAHPKAKEWHGSKEGIEWHRKHWEESIGKNLSKDCLKRCVVCNELFPVSKRHLERARFCGNNCKSQYRRNEKLDKISKVCCVCGIEWLTDKYDKAISCSPKCRGVLKSENSKDKKH